MEITNQTVPKKMKKKMVTKYYGVSQYFLQKAIHDGRLSYTKIGNSYMIDTEELEKLIEANTFRK